MNLSKLSACLVVLPLAACSHQSLAPEARNAPSAAPVSEESAASGTYAQADSAGPDGYVAPQPSAPSASAAPGAAPRSASAGHSYAPEAEKKAEDRAGLGTTWGETRESRVSNVSFNRADYAHPFALVSLNYNDQSGIEAMARRAGNSYASFGGEGVDAGHGVVSLRLLDENGSALPSANFGGRDYVAGEDGQRYVIEIVNHTSQRFEAVASVDGLDVVDGKSGSISKRGYILDAWATLDIDGFRRSQAAVAAFRFGAVKDSYAARKGEDRNVGVIGVAFFHEQGSSLPWLERELDRRDSANPFPGGFAEPPVPMAR